MRRPILNTNILLTIYTNNSAEIEKILDRLYQGAAEIGKMRPAAP